MREIGEAAVAKAMIGRSRTSIVLADPSKFGRQGIAHIADSHQINHLVSSEQPGADIYSVLAKIGS